MTYRDQQRLADISSAIVAIRAHLERGDLSDGLIFDAVRIRLLEIGEAAKALPAELHVRRSPRLDGLVFSSSSLRPLTKAIAGHAFDQIERDVRLSVSPHLLRHYFGASLISRGVSVAAGREAIAKTMRQVVRHVYPLCTEKGAQ